jgi:Fic family protein
MSDKQLNLRQLAVISGARVGQEYTLKDISDLITAPSGTPKTSPATVRRDIAQLVAAGFFLQSGDRRGTRYRLNPVGLIHAPINAHQYCSIDIDDRSGNREFNRDLFASIGTDLFTPQELTQLQSATETFARSEHGATPAITKRELERFVIELSWKSSKIEGNTYSLLDTEFLLKDGIEAQGKSREETLMVLNHKRAFDFVLAHKLQAKTPNQALIDHIHQILVSGLGIQFGIRHRLIGITGSIYRPLDVPSQIHEALQDLLRAVNQQSDPYSRALLLLAGIAYIQPFEDGNKRCSRLSANAILIAFNCAPLSYRSISEIAYREAMLTFYEKNTINPLKKIFIEQYLFACANYLKFF